MTIRQTTISDLLCDFCRTGERLSTPTLRTVPVREVLQDAEADGWKRVRRDGKMKDMCPDCVEASD